MEILFENFLDKVFKKEDKNTKINKIIDKIHKSFNLMTEEAGGEDNLKKGAELSYDNFGDFVDYCYDFIQLIMNDIIPYRESVKEVLNMADKITNIIGVSSISVAKFEYVKRNLYKMMAALI